MWSMRRRRALAEAPVRCYLAFLTLLAGPAVRLDASSCNSLDGLQEFYIDNSTGVTGLHDALNCSSGGQFKAFWVGSVTVNESLAVGAGMSLTVIGEPGAEAVGSFGSRIFDVSQGGILNVSQLRLTGGLEYEGGAIFSESSTVILDNCKLDNNMAIENGGGLFATGGEVIIVGGEFTGNAAIAPDVQATFEGSGGAVYTMDANLTIRDHAQFKSNWAVQGGGVFCGASSPQFDNGNVSCLIMDSSFSSNEASLVREIQSYGDGIFYINHHGGGAVYILHAAAEVTGCRFEGNTAEVGGGALFGQVNTSVDVRSCVFRDNHTPGLGGAVAASTVTVEGSIMEGNSAELRGGAVSSNGQYPPPPRCTTGRRISSLTLFASNSN